MSDELNKAQVRKLKSFAKADRIRREEGLKLIVSDRNSRAFLWDLLAMTGALGKNPMGRTSDETAFNCGMQNVGQKILADLCEIVPDAYLQMIKESADEQRERAASIERSGNPGSSDDTDDAGDTTYQ